MVEVRYEFAGETIYTLRTKFVPRTGDVVVLDEAYKVGDVVYYPAGKFVIVKLNWN